NAALGGARDVVQDLQRPQTWFAGMGRTGVWRSNDDGSTWRRLPGQPTTRPMRVALAAGGDRVTAAIAGNDGRAAVWTSGDRGNHWSPVAVPQDLCRGAEAEAAQCDYDLALAAD